MCELNGSDLHSALTMVHAIRTAFHVFPVPLVVWVPAPRTRSHVASHTVRLFRWRWLTVNADIVRLTPRLGEPNWSPRDQFHDFSAVIEAFTVNNRMRAEL